MSHLEASSAKAAKLNAEVVPSCIDIQVLDEAWVRAAKAKYVEGEFTSVGYDPRTDTVAVITTMNPLEFQFPNQDDVTLTPMARGSVLRLGRLDDVSPYKGGGRIITADGQPCSTGFYVNSSTFGTVMVTSGHCADANGETILNGNMIHSLGTIEGRQLPNPDLALIDGRTYLARSFAWEDNSTLKSVANSANPLTGTYYCNLGSFSQRVCSTYSSLNMQFCDVEGCTTGLAFTSQHCQYGPLAEGGDSGGGIVRELADAKIGARGIVVAGGQSGDYCVRYDHRWSTVASTYSATIMTAP
jgi:hypothetical protein